MAATPEKDFHKDIEAIRADIAALTDTVGKLASEAVKAQAAIAKNVKKAAKNAGHVGEEIWEGTIQLGSDTAEAATDATHVGMASLETQIKRNPVSAVIIALSVGFVVSLIGNK